MENCFHDSPSGKIFFLITRSDNQNLECCFSEENVDAWKSIQIFSNAVGEDTAGLIFEAGGNKRVSQYLKEKITIINNLTKNESFSLTAQILVSNSMSKENITTLFKLENVGFS